MSKASKHESREDPMVFETLTVRKAGGVLFADIAAPPMNLLGPALVRDLVSLLQRAEADDAVQVLVFTSADPDYFIAHVDVTRITAYREEAAKLTGEASIGLLFRHLSASRLVTIAQIEGRVRGAGSEFVLACDMRFAARESAIFGQPEAGFGLLPGAGGLQHLARLIGRARALEVLLSADDYDADLAERYGWINRALPAAALGEFVASLAQRIAGFPAAAQAMVKERLNAITLAPAEEFRRDSDLFGAAVRAPRRRAASRRRCSVAFRPERRKWRLAGCWATWLTHDRAPGLRRRTDKGAQGDQRRGHDLHAIVPLLDTFKAEEQALAFVFPDEGPLNAHPSHMNRSVEETFASALGRLAMARMLCDIGDQTGMEDARAIASGIKAPIEIEIRSTEAHPSLFGAPGVLGGFFTVVRWPKSLLYGHGKSGCRTLGQSMVVATHIPWGFWPPYVKGHH